ARDRRAGPQSADHVAATPGRAGARRRPVLGLAEFRALYRVAGRRRGLARLRTEGAAVRCVRAGVRRCRRVLPLVSHAFRAPAVLGGRVGVVGYLRAPPRASSGDRAPTLAPTVARRRRRVLPALPHISRAPSLRNGSAQHLLLLLAKFRALDALQAVQLHDER